MRQEASLHREYKRLQSSLPLDFGRDKQVSLQPWCEALGPTFGVLRGKCDQSKLDPDFKHTAVG